MRPALPLAAAALLAATVGVGCTTPKATCDTYFAKMDKIRDDEEKFAALEATVMLLDVSDNSERSAEQVSKAFEQEIRAAVETGGWLVARLSGGDNQPVVGEESCFSVTNVYQVDKNNQSAEEDEQLEGRGVLADALEAQVRGTVVQAQGSAVRLLHEGSEVVERLIAEEGVAPGQITIYLYSDLLGTSDDCLNLNDKVALPDVAEKIVDGCFQVQQIESLPDGVGFVTRAAGDRAETTAQETLAGHVENLLCHRISTTCGT